MGWKRMCPFCLILPTCSILRKIRCVACVQVQAVAGSRWVIAGGIAQRGGTRMGEQMLGDRLGYSLCMAWTQGSPRAHPPPPACRQPGAVC